MPNEDSALTRLGFVSMDSDEGDVYVRVGQVTATRISGPFYVRGESRVQHIKDGWCCKGEGGYLFGLEAAIFDQALVLRGNVQSLPSARVGVAYDQAAILPFGGFSFVSATILPSSTMPTGLGYASGTQRITGTPALGSEGSYYMEFQCIWEGVTRRVQRSVLAVYP